MSRFDVNVFQDEIVQAEGPVGGKGRSRLGLKISGVVAVVLLLAASALALGGFLYWRSLTGSPQYALASIVVAAREGDDDEINRLVDVDAVVEDFAPQVTDKAIELYGRGLPADVISKAKIVAAPILPVIKQRARAELPALLRETTKEYSEVPFWGLVVGADRYLKISIEGDSAVVKSSSKTRPTELIMKRSGDGWKVVAVKDDVLAEKIAGKIGQELIFLAAQAGRENLGEVGKRLGIEGIDELLKQAEDIFR